MELLLGIDDTDVLGHKPGTGRLARDLGAHLQEQRLARLIGVVRHQLLVDPRIPYTSHNSPACVVLAVDGLANGSGRRLFQEATSYIVSRCAQGSDPGLCLADKTKVGEAVVHFGWRASSEVVSKADALELGQRHDLLLEELGGTGDGVIGALAAVGLTADGNGGRFLELSGGLRDLGERVTARLLRERGITLLSISRNGEVVPTDAMITTGDWLRPRLVGGRPVLFVEQTEEGWCCFDRKKRHADSDHEESM
jgi:hypothetical protein